MYRKATHRSPKEPLRDILISSYRFVILWGSLSVNQLNIKLSSGNSDLIQSWISNSKSSSSISEVCKNSDLLSNISLNSGLDDWLDTWLDTWLADWLDSSFHIILGISQSIEGLCK